MMDSDTETAGKALARLRRVTSAVRGFMDAPQTHPCVTSHRGWACRYCTATLSRSQLSRPPGEALLHDLDCPWLRLYDALGGDSP